MPEFFRETQSIQKNWRVLNNDLRIVLDKIPFDLEPEVFEQKCNEIIKTKIFPDSDYTIANIFGFESKTIHQFVGENFDKISSDNPDFFKLSKIHLLFDKDGKKSTFLAFSNCDKKVYDDLSLTGMPSQLTFKRPRFFFQTPLRQLFYSALPTLNIFNTTSSAQQIEALRQNMPNPTKRIKSDDENCVAIPSFEKLRIAQLVGKSFDLELFDGTELLEKYESSINPQLKNKKLSDKYLSLKFNLPVHKIGFFDDEKNTLGSYNSIEKNDFSSESYEFGDNQMTTSNYRITKNRIRLNKFGSYLFPPSEFSNDETIVHEFGHSLLYPKNHPNPNISRAEIAFATVVLDDNLSYVDGGLNPGGFCNETKFEIGPIDIIAKKFAEYCSFRFQNNTQNGRELNSFFQNSSISKFNKDFCLPRPTYNSPFIQDTLLNFTTLLTCLTAVDLILSIPISKSNSSQDENKKNSTRKNLLLAFAVVNSFATQNNYASVAIASLIITENFGSYLYKKSGLKNKEISADRWQENYCLRSIAKPINQIIEKTPQIIKDEITILSKFAFIMTFGEIMGDSYFDTSSHLSDNAFYKKPDQDLSQKILPHIIASLAIGAISIMSKQFYKSLKDLKTKPQTSQKINPIDRYSSPRPFSNACNQNSLDLSKSPTVQDKNQNISENPNSETSPRSHQALFQKTDLSRSIV